LETREYKRLIKIKKDCKLCDGNGYSVIPNGVGKIQIMDCVCIQQITREMKYVSANIPLKYRSEELNLYPDFIEKNKKALGIVQTYTEKLDENIGKGAGLWFFSTPGLAKSALICGILKAAIDQEYEAVYTSATSIISLKLHEMHGDIDAKKILRNIINNAQIIAIDDFEKRSIGKFFMKGLNKNATEETTQNLVFYEFLNAVHAENISLLISTNILREACEKTMPPFINDRLNVLTSIPLAWLNKSGRRKH